MEKLTDALFMARVEEKESIIKGLGRGIRPYPWSWLVLEETVDRFVIEIRRRPGE